MRKKLVALFLACCMAFAALGLVSCGDDVAELELGVKYYYESNARADEEYCKTYVIFNKNNTGTYHYYYTGSYSSATEYTVKFKYTYVDEDKSAVVCFYNGMEIGEHNRTGTSYLPSSNWTKMFTVSKNVLMSATSSGTQCFINANYLKKELTNFGK